MTIGLDIANGTSHWWKNVVDLVQQAGEISLVNRECRLDSCADELRLRQRLVRLFDASHRIQNVLRGDLRQSSAVCRGDVRPVCHLQAGDQDVLTVLRAED